MAALNVAFDLDGTLVDSRPGIERAAARSVARVWPGRAPVPLSPLIGPPIAAMLAAAYPDATADELVALVDGFREAYDGGDWRATIPFPSLPEVLGQLTDAGARLFVVTNKPARPTQLLLDHLGVHERFTRVVARDGPEPFAQKSDALTRLARRYTWPPERAVYVGDAHEDRLAAKLSGVKFVAALYGYGAVGSSPTDLGAIKELRELPSVVVDRDEP